MFEIFQSKNTIKGCEVQLFYDPIEEGEQNQFYSPRGRGRGRYHKREDRRPEPVQENIVKMEDMANYLKPSHKGTLIF